MALPAEEVTMGDTRDKIEYRKDATADCKPDMLQQEAAGGMEKHTQTEVENRQNAKNQKSGITGEFGKPELYDGTPGKTTKNTNGQVDSITYADGKSNKFQYDAGGKLARVINSDGTSWAHEEGLWFKYDKSGERVDHFDGKMYVTKYGEIVQKDGEHVVNVTHRNGKTEGVQKDADGTRTVTNPDHSEISKVGGRVDRVKYPDGDYSHFEYDNKGKLNRIKNADDTTWSRDGDSWVKAGKDGKPIERYEGNFSVGPDGSVVQKNHDGSWVKTRTLDGDEETICKYPDGTSSVTDKSGYRVEFDKSGHIINVQQGGDKV